MNEYRREAFRLLLSSCTEHPTDRHRALIAFQACQTPHEMTLVKVAYLAKRIEWLNYLSWQQRKWQSSTAKNPKKGRHHDSWALREQYMRCNKSNYHDFLEYAHMKRSEA